MFQESFQFDNKSTDIPWKLFRLLNTLIVIVFILIFISESTVTDAYAQGSWVKVFVHISRVESHEKVDNGNNPADLYSEVFFGNRKIKRVAPGNQDYVNTNWWFEGPTQNSSRRYIRITLRDSDGNSGDEHIDIAPVTGRTELLLKVYPFAWGGSRCGLVRNESFDIERSSSNGERPYDFIGVWKPFKNSQICIIENLNSLGDGWDKHRGYIKYSIYVIRL